MTGSGSVSARNKLIVTGVITVAVAVAVAAALAVAPLLAGAEAAPADSASAAPAAPGKPATPVISATPIPEPTRAAVDWDTLTEEEQAALFEGEGPRGTALALVQESYPHDFAYGYMVDGGFGVGFKADAPAEALTILNAVGDPYELHENVGFAEPDLQPQLSRVSALLQRVVPTGQTFGVSANPFTVTVEVELFTGASGSTEFPPLTGSALVDVTAELRAVLYPGFGIDITSVPGRIEPLAG